MLKQSFKVVLIPLKLLFLEIVSHSVEVESALLISTQTPSQNLLVFFLFLIPSILFLE
jgi:hypothetical protein